MVVQLEGGSDFFEIARSLLERGETTLSVARSPRTLGRRAAKVEHPCLPQCAVSVGGTLLLRCQISRDT